MQPKTISAIKARIAKSKTARARVRAVVKAGNASAAEEDATRNAAYDARVAKAAGMPESIVETNDFQPASFLPDGSVTRRAIGRVLVQIANESISGSGFLISPDLFMTNQHVIANAAYAKAAVVIFDDELDHLGKPRERTTYSFDPDRLALFSDENDLDYALIAIGARVAGAATLEELGYCPLNFTPDRHRKGMNVNIIQHPNSLPKTIAIRNNLVTDRQETKLLYETDTEVGSSGSPVFNDQWDIVALHHYGSPTDRPQNPGATVISVNEGIRISAIYKALQARATQLDDVSRELINRALTLWTDSVPAGKQLIHRPLTAPAFRSESTLPTSEQTEKEAHMSKSDAGAFTFVVPLEIAIRVGAASTIVTEMHKKVEGSLTSEAQKTLTKPEATKRDLDYSNRNGFNESFVPGFKLDLTAIVKPRKISIAPLNQGESSAAGGELKYQNFSLVMHKERRFALVTATNIDGPTYLSINRKTGEPNAKQPEGETWCKDPRISEAFFVDQSFYSEWSHLFDRGHLTRRDDPTWGKFATRANKDTFHFTNCTPQHWKFNQSIEYWQGIERFVLERGLFVSGRDARLTVFQGPIFDDTNDLMADSVQIPSAFWKIVVWKGKGGKKVVGMMANQAGLFSQVRLGGAEPPPPETPVEVTQFLASVETIEKKTGLVFASLRQFDTFGKELPTVGEALRLITKWDDIPLN